MQDKTLSIALIVIFGLSGILLLMAAWTLPSLAENRLMACIAGLIGVGFAVVRGYMLRHENHRDSRVAIEVESQQHTRER